MNGVVRNVLAQKGFGFIIGSDTKEYFFHMTDFNGHWPDLIQDIYDKSNTIEVKFEPDTTPKGLRARIVSRLDWPNQAA